MCDVQRCRWCNLKNPVYVEYHDRQWGVPQYEDGTLFEFLILELFQAGLSWETILNKREDFRRAFDGFDPEIIKNYGAEKIESLMKDASIVRNRRKIEAAIQNAGEACSGGEYARGGLSAHAADRNAASVQSGRERFSSCRIPLSAYAF